MHDPVEGGCAQQLVVEGVVPLREVQIAGDDRRFPLVALCDDVVEVLVLSGAHGLEAEVVDDEQLRLGQSRQFALVRAHCPCRGELAQELGVGGEYRVVAATYGDVPQGLSKVALAGTTGADDEHRGLLLQVAAGGQIHDLSLVHFEVEVEVVAFKRLLCVDAGPALPHDNLAFFTTSDLLRRAGQEVGVGKLLLYGLVVATLLLAIPSPLCFKSAGIGGEEVRAKCFWALSKSGGFYMGAHEMAL